MGIRFLSQETPGFDEQRLALSAFVSEGAKLLIADEIFTGANPKASDLKEFLLNSRNKDVGILVSGFNVRDALDIVDRAYLIYDGRIMQSGSRRDLLGDA
jgi:lipopolysaccharide export system ATP-binding protein